MPIKEYHTVKNIAIKISIELFVSLTISVTTALCLSTTTRARGSYFRYAMVMIDDARGVWGHAPPGKYVSAKMVYL